VRRIYKPCYVEVKHPLREIYKSCYVEEKHPLRKIYKPFYDTKTQMPDRQKGQIK